MSTLNLTDLRRNIIYTTHRDGREFLIVFSGEDGNITPIVKQGEHGAVKVRAGYLNADGTEPDMRDAEYAWIPFGLITVSRRLPERPIVEQSQQAAPAVASTRAVIDRYTESEGWTTDTVLDLLVQFIDSQAGGPDDLDDFLADAAYDDDVDDDGLTDVEADAMTLASAGYGTDEDYGYTGEDDWS